jgi:hypothetical protein
MEGMRIIDEVNRCGLPSLRSTHRIAVPLRAKLRELNEEQLDVFQVAMQQPQLDSVLNNCSLDDIAIARALSHLIEHGYLDVLPAE